MAQTQEIPSSLVLFPEIYSYLSPRDHILDFGCGTGKTYAELHSRGFNRFTGIDINLPAVRIAYQQAKQIGGYKQAFFVGDVRHLPFTDCSFDFGIMQALLTVVIDSKNRACVLTEASRVLVQNGKLYIAEFCQTWYSQRYRERYIKGLEITGYEGTFPVFDNDTQKVQYYAHHFSAKEMVGLLFEAGFEILLFQYAKFPTSSGHVIDGIVTVSQNKRGV